MAITITIDCCTDNRIAKFAKYELQKYLDMTNSSHNAPATIQLRLITNDQTVTDDTFDGFSITWHQNELTISAIQHRGFLNAAYWLLKKIGFSFPYPGLEHVPQEANWQAVKNTTQRTLWQTPSFNHRILHFDNMRLTPDTIDWLGKLAINMIQQPKHVYIKDIAANKELSEMVKDRGIELNVGCHGFDSWLSPITYGPIHPEWYAKSHGVNRGRFSEPDDNELPGVFTSGQLCLSNKEMHKVFTDSIIKFVKDHPEIKIISLWPNDVGNDGGWCTCENCLALEPDPQRLDTQSNAPSKSASYLWFINQITPIIQKELPNIRIEFCAFYEFATPPLNTEIIPQNNNFLGCLVDDYFGCLIHGHNCQCNKPRIEDAHKKWRKLFKGEIYGLGYYSDLCKTMDFPMVYTSKIKDDFKYLKETLEIDSVLTLVCCASLEYTFQKMFPNIYSFASLAWDHKKTSQEVLETLAAEINPKQPEPVFRYLKTWDETGTRYPDKHAGWIWLEPENLDSYTTSADKCRFLTIRDLFEENHYLELKLRIEQMQSLNSTSETTATIINYMANAFNVFQKLYAYDPSKPASTQLDTIEQIRVEAGKRGPFPGGIIPLLHRLTRKHRITSKTKYAKA